MGVADNKSYKNQYHFTDDYRDIGKEYPSIDGKPRINTTIKENPYRSNVEIEGGELVLQPDLTALFKAVGKKHTGGGMDVLLKPNSFIFSDDKTLALTPEECEMFELKKSGGTHTPSKYTPAEVVKKNIPPKHYNTLINNIADPFKDDLARKSSAMMLEKYIGTLGNIAFAQEQKKNFPDGLPDFSVGSAPVYDQDLKNQIDENKQYMKYGGYTMPTGGYVDKCPCGKDSKGDCIPCSPEQLAQLKTKATKGTLKDVTGMTKIGTLDLTDLYHAGTDPSRSKIKQGMTNQQWIEYLKNESPERKAKRLASYQNTPGSDKLISIENKLSGPDNIPYPTWSWKAKENLPAPNPTDVTGDAQGYKRADWKFTPWQKISQLYNWGQYANVKRYMPYRSRFNATFADPSLVNPEQTIGDMKGLSNQQLKATNSLNPVLANSQRQGLFGQFLNQVPGVRSQYDNQNAQIKNQFTMYNNQTKNNETAVNMGNDQNYYQQAVEGRVHFDNMRTHTANNAMNNVMRDVETDQTLAYNLLTQNNPAYGYDWDSGHLLRNQKDIRDVASNPQSDILSGIFAEYLQDPAKFQSLDPRVQAALIKSSTIKGLPLNPSAPNFLGKKGGKVKTKNPYKY